MGNLQKEKSLVSLELALTTSPSHRSKPPFFPYIIPVSQSPISQHWRLVPSNKKRRKSENGVFVIRNEQFTCNTSCWNDDEQGERETKNNKGGHTHKEKVRERTEWRAARDKLTRRSYTGEYDVQRCQTSKWKCALLPIHKPIYSIFP